MNDVAIFLPLAAAVVGALASAVALLYRDLSKARDTATERIKKLEEDLDKERTARIATAERNTEWALKLQEAQHIQIDKLTGIADVLQKRRP